MKIRFAILAVMFGIISIYGNILPCRAFPPLNPGCPEQLENPFSIPGGVRTEYPPIICTQEQLNGLLCQCSDSDWPSAWQCKCSAGYKVHRQSYNDCSCNVCDANTYNETNNVYEGCTACPAGTKTVGTTPADHDDPSDCVPIITCPAGEYANLVTETCVKCPFGAKDTSDVDIYGSSATPGNDSISKCFMPAGTYKDTSGTFETSASCSVSRLIIDPHPIVTP